MTRRRRGVSMVEIGIFVPIGLMVVAIAWTFFSGSAKTSKKADAKLQGIQTNLILALNLERDTESLYENQRFPISLLPDRTAIRFFSCQEDSPEDSWDPLPVEQITYRFDKATGRVYRQEGDDAEEALYGFFEQVYFLVNNAQRAEGAATDPLPLTSTIDFIATAIPEEEFRKPPMERNPLLTSTLVSSVKRRWNAGRYAYPFWNPIPYYPQPE